MNKLQKQGQHKAEEKTVDLNRRKILKNALIAACLFNTTPGFSKTSTKHPQLTLRMAGYRLDRVEALYDGRVQVQGCETQFVVDSIGAMNANLFSGPQSYDVSEVGLHPFILAYANEGFRDYRLIPVFPLRAFRHKSIFVRSDGSIRKPEDLRGKKVATPGFSSTSLTWLRGIVQHEYGLKPDEIEWVISSKDSSADVAGKLSAQEDLRPGGLSISAGPDGKDESDMLLDGDVDAIFHAAEPRAFRKGDKRVIRLFTNYRKVEREYYAQTGIFPIMHAVAIRNDLIDKNPWLPAAVFDAYSEAKQLMYAEWGKTGWASNSLPWFINELEETRALMGDNFWPYGIEPNRKALETLLQYSYEQGLSRRQLKIEDIFHPSTLELMDA